MKTKSLTAICVIILHSAFCLSLRAQGTSFTYQGQVTDSGTSFNGSGQFKFALVTSTNANLTAMATANVPSGGFITSYTVTFGGNGYASAPAVTVFGGGGSGAAAHANINAGAVTSLTVDNTGNGGYTSAPTVSIAPPPADNSYTTYWSNDGTSVAGSEPTDSVDVTVKNGLFTVVLGDTDMTSIDTSLFSQPNLQLRIWFSDGTNGFVALDPAQNLTPAPYAAVAQRLGNGLTVQSNTNGPPNVIGGSSGNFVSSGVVGANIDGGGASNEVNAVSADYDAIGGGAGNSIQTNSDHATISGGEDNTVQYMSDHATIGGGQANFIGVYSWQTTIAGGADNTIQNDSQYSAIGGGTGNSIENNANVSTIAGGDKNTVQYQSDHATIGGGQGNLIGFQSPHTTIAGGVNNTIQNAAAYSAIGGGATNTIETNAGYSTIGGGTLNIASGALATVPGGGNNMASGYSSFAAGSFAQALHDGAFVWADDSTVAPFSSTGSNQFLIRAAGGVGIGTTAPQGLFDVVGNTTGSFSNSTAVIENTSTRATASPALHIIGWGNMTHGVLNVSANGTGLIAQFGNFENFVADIKTNGTIDAVAFNTTSDRKAKENFQPVDTQTVLSKVTALPISQWNFKIDPQTQHLGPMAQDFRAAFGLGSDDKHIATVDEEGVALAAIQGLYQKLEQKETEITELKQANDSLARRLEKLEQLILAKAAGVK